MAYVPRPPYSPEELAQLYPTELRLKHVQVILRHGERTPVKVRFGNAGVPTHWPYCSAARRMRSVILSSASDGERGFDTLEWKRQLETFAKDDGPAVARSAKGSPDDICNLGELTDRGRETTLALGQRLRHLYVDQLNFLPSQLADPSMLYIRATPIVRALESVQQAFSGLYPTTARAPTMPAPTIVTRSYTEEILFPNENSCRRFGQLSRAFAQRAADIWNDSPEMDFLNKTLGKWMPPTSPRIGVDSSPRLSGIMDSTNATLAHGPETKLPAEFYDPKVRDTMDKIVVDEWFRGYIDSEEYRTLGIGGLARDMTVRMVDAADDTTRSEDLNRNGARFCLSGAHDTTLAALVASFGAYEIGKWPPFTSHIAFELFEKQDAVSTRQAPKAQNASSWWSSFGFFGGATAATSQQQSVSRKRFEALNGAEKEKLHNHYVRVRYNDKSIAIPGCKPAGRHLEGDETFCTLAAFKEIADKFAPVDWQRQCHPNLDQPAIPATPEPAGH